jgi:4-amino-4-deoxy-L-arabinose transferase-like glycosyltransferase
MNMTNSAAARSFWPADGLAAFVDYAVGSHRRAAALLVLVSLLTFLPGFFQIPPVDRDESYFAQATKQMLETGNYVDIRYQNNVRYRKPIGIYWLQAGVVRAAQALGVPAAREKIWLYRVPSLLGALGAVLATFWCALAFVSRRAAVLAGLMMAGSVLLGVEARLAETDAVLLFTIVLAMGALARAYMLPRKLSGAGDAVRLDWRVAALFWTALAAGILDKGPVNLMVVGLAALTLSIIERSGRWLKALRPLAGMAWMILLVLPWFVAIYWRAGNAFLVDSVGHDMLAKIGGGQETHGEPPGYYIILFFVTFFPGSALAPAAVPAIWSMRRQLAMRFLLAWLVPSWIVFELVPTKLPHYVLPLYPAIAMLLATIIDKNQLSTRPSLQRVTILWFLAPVVLSSVAIGVAIALSRGLEPLSWPFLAGGIVCGLVAWRVYAVDGAERSLLRMFAAAILGAIGIYGIVLPSLAPAFPSVALASVVRGASCPHPVAASVGYQEPSLVFLAGTATRLTDPSSAADFLRQGGCRLAFVDANDQKAFARRAEAIGLHYRAGPTIKGFNISNGQKVTITAFEPTGAAAAPAR